MDKTYIIRKYAYQYNDVYNEFECEGDIEYVSNNYEEAYAAWRTRELEAFKTAELNHVEPLAITDPEMLARSKQELHDYMQANFGVNLFRFFNPDGTPEWFWTEMPVNATDEQLWEIRRITGVRYYSLTTFDEDASFYTLEIRNPICIIADRDDSTGLITYNGEVMFYNSPEDAMNSLGHHLFKFDLTGTPEELSDMPDLLRQLIVSDEIFSYGETGRQLTVNVPWGRNQSAGKILVQFFALLKEPLVVLHKMPLEEARKTRFFTYE